MAESGITSSEEAAFLQREELLGTKLSVPRTRADHLGRSRLIKDLDEAMARPVILVCTPPGFGKTTLLAHWATTASWPVAWLSLDPEDNDAMRFWRYVVVALDRVCEGLGEHVLSLIRPPSVTSSRGIVTALINEFEAVPDELALVLDDYHTMESRSIHDDMAFFLSHLPPRLHVVITSRTDPPLPLGRFRATGQLAELRAADLRFTPEESSALLREAWKLELSPHAVEALQTRTEGWAVGLQLAALSLRERPDPDGFVAAFTGTHRYVLDYLSQEVLDRQPQDVMAFLLHTSILERLSGPLCDAVTGRSDGQEMLEALERANLFLLPLDEERRWYRFHHLFGDLLRARLHRAEGASVPGLHRRAAAWFEQHGLIDDAIPHAVASGDALWAARLAEQRLNETMQRGETVILERWLSALPEETVRSRPPLTFAKGLMQFHLGHLHSVERLLEQAERAFGRGQSEPNVEVPTDAGMVADVGSAIALLRAEIAGARGDAEAAAEHARSALGQMREQEHGPRFWARWVSGPGADWMCGRLADAERGFAELVTEGRAASDPYPVMLSSLALGRLQQARGKLAAALRTYREGLRLASQAGRFSAFNAGESHFGIAEVLYERNQLDDALEHITQSIELGRQVIWFYEQDRRLATLAWTRYAMGDADAAMEALNQIDPSPEVVSLWNPAPSERARLLLARGDVAEAARWTEERGLRAEDDVPYAREREYLILARVLLARSDPELALRLLERLDEQAASQNRTESLIRIRALRSLALQSTGDHAGALVMLVDALEVARPQGYIRIFADEGPPMAALLRSLVGARRRVGAAAMTDATREHLNRVVRAFGPVSRVDEGARAGTRLIEPLTDRELEVLRFVAAGKRNQEIARELVVTLETVKKHLSNIFRKLGASTRVQAVTRARELGLIS